MTVIQLKTIVCTPIVTCYRLSLSIDLELDAVQEYGVKAVGGITRGNIRSGERVTWRTKQFGITVTHTSEITSLEEPTYFQDVMVQGIFRSFRHDHFFRSLEANRTEMRDELFFSMPWYLMAQAAEHFFVKRRLTILLAKRNALIKERAEFEFNDAPTPRPSNSR